MDGVRVEYRDDGRIRLILDEQGPPVHERWAAAGLDPDDIAELHVHPSLDDESVRPVLEALKSKRGLDTVVSAFPLDKWMPYLPGLTHAPPLLTRLPDGVRIEVGERAGLQRTLARNASMRGARRVELVTSVPVALELQQTITHLFVSDARHLAGDLFLRLTEATVSGPIDAETPPVDPAGLPALHRLTVVGDPPPDLVERVFGALRSNGCDLVVGGVEHRGTKAAPTVQQRSLTRPHRPASTPPEPIPDVGTLLARGLKSPSAAIDPLRAGTAELRGRFLDAVVADAGHTLAFSTPHSRLLDPMCSAGVLLSDDALTRLVRAFARGAGYPGRSMHFDLAARSVVALLEERETLSFAVASAASKWARVLEDDALTTRLDRRLARASTPHLVEVSLGDDWGLFVETWAVGLPIADRRRWSAVFRLAAQATRSTPSHSWDARGRSLVQDQPKDAFTTQLLVLLDRVDLHSVRMASVVSRSFGIDAHNTCIVRGMIWLARFLDADRVAAPLASLAAAGFRKLPGVGAANSAVGRAAVLALGELPDKGGIPALTRLEQTVRYAVARRAIEAAMEHAANQAGQTTDDAIETGLPDHGLDPTGRRYVQLDDVTAILQIDGRNAVLKWKTPRRAKPLKSPPKRLMAAHAEQVRLLRDERKALQRLLTAQPKRLEALYDSERALPLQDFVPRYLEHPVVGSFARRLIWWVTPEQGEPTAALWERGVLRSVDGTAITGAATVQLWHPMHEPDASRVAMLRERIAASGIVQPFPQVYRAVFEPGADPVDHRFTGFLVEKSVVRAVAHREGWHYDWHPRNPGDLTKRFGALVVVLHLETVTHDAEVMRTTHLSVQPGSDPWSALPRQTASEILLAVDRVVAAARLRSSDDPTLQTALFGPLTATGEARRAALIHTLDRLSLEHPCTIHGDLLQVVGPTGTIEIHVGTGATRMNGTPRAIRPGKALVAEAETVFLPFEGDPLLRQILATVLTWQATVS
jgi:hypothetical protein